MPKSAAPASETSRNGVEKGQALKAFGSSLKGFPNFLVVRRAFSTDSGLKADSPLNARIASLKGKNIAVNDIGGSAGDFVRELLRRGGLGERDAVMINISSTPGRLAALKAKRIDALVGYAPEPETADSRGLWRDPDQLGDRYPGNRRRSNTSCTSAGRPSSRTSPPWSSALVRALAKATKLMKDDTAVARDAFFAQMAAKAFGATTDPKLAELQWNNMRPYFATAMAITDAGMAGPRKFFHIASSISDDTLIDNAIAQRVDQTTR